MNAPCVMHVSVCMHVFTNVCMYTPSLSPKREEEGIPSFTPSPSLSPNVYVCICIYANMHFCMYVCMYVCMYASICETWRDGCMYAYEYHIICMHMSICIQAFLFVQMCTCMYVCISPCMCVCVHVFGRHGGVGECTYM